jgi:hypothetical protein
METVLALNLMMMVETMLLLLALVLMLIATFRLVQECKKVDSK